MPQIDVQSLAKHYRVHRKAAGFMGSLRSFFRRRYQTVTAVDDINFQIEAGEVVGFLGPNGAGKTTTLKVLSGLLHPTAGRARILGFTPHERKSPFLKQITLVMGQKNQLNWDLPAMESFVVNQAVYDIPADTFRQTLAELTTLLDLDTLIDKQVRKRSLGERMKCELAAALLHRPRVLFLDEPTIGIDVVMQTRIRQFVAEYNRRHGATVILTSHYMADVTALCKRVLVIDHGKLILYSIWLMMATSAFWFVRIDDISELFSAIYETGRFPVSVYPSWMRGALTFVVPIAFITTFPAAAVLGRAKPLLLALAFLLAAGFFWGCVCFWRFAVRRYSSASS